ncbi:hypothetical protein SAMN05216223_102382 [Actinacidiphila yanglinensis]|uniref:Uncharacterized protein n=2 Tax=Actinacidiphila yanglinensis TaxID=310779 RepID=A0A1H5VPG9_9ACTN|nr:hypothetical protein SAMN05216223_102382 [Actinacidiphila yanglinensis]
MAGYGGGEAGLLAELIAALESTPALRTADTRKVFLRLAELELNEPTGVQDHPAARYFHVELAVACLRNPRMMAAASAALATLDEEGTAEVRRIAEELLAQPVLPPEQESVLRQLLKGLVTPRLPQLCQDAAGELHDPPDPPPDDAWSAYEALSGLNAREDRLPPSLALVEYLAAEVAYDQAIALRAWNDRQAAALGLVSEMGVLRQRVVYAPPKSAHDAYLVIRLLPRESPGRYELTSWRHYGSDDPANWQPRPGPTAVWTLAEAERQVEQLLFEAEETWARDADQIHVEFALLTEDLNLPVQAWRYELDSDTPMPLCAKYLVVVRSLTRGRTERWHRPWRQRWQLLRENPAQWHSLMVGGSGPGHPPVGRPTALEARLNAEMSVGALVLSGPPEENGDGGFELQAALRSGVPVVLWLGRDELPPGDAGARAPETAGPAADPGADHATESGSGPGGAHSPVEAEEHFERLLRDPLRLREAVKELRLEAQSDFSREPRDPSGAAVPPGRTHHRVGHRVVLLWDDPTRPVETHEPLSGPDRGDRRRVDGQ